MASKKKPELQDDMRTVAAQIGKLADKIDEALNPPKPPTEEEQIAASVKASMAPGAFKRLLKDRRKRKAREAIGEDDEEGGGEGGGAAAPPSTPKPKRPGPR